MIFRIKKPSHRNQKFSVSKTILATIVATTFVTASNRIWADDCDAKLEKCKKACFLDHEERCNGIRIGIRADCENDYGTIDFVKEYNDCIKSGDVAYDVCINENIDSSTCMDKCWDNWLICS